jgi:hypothetical protein
VGVPTLVVQGAADPFGVPRGGPLHSVVTVPGTHSLTTDLHAVATAVADWLPRVLIPRTLSSGRGDA